MMLEIAGGIVLAYVLGVLLVGSIIFVGLLFSR